MDKNKIISSIIFVGSLVLSSVFLIIFPSNNATIVWFSTILGVLSSKMASSGKWHMFVFDIISYMAYIYTSLKAFYFGEVVLSIIVIIINMFCLYEWKNNQKDDIIIINHLNKNEIKFSIFVAVILTLIYSVFLYMANTSFVLINAIATISYLLGSYFCYRRSVLQFYSWIIYEIMFVILWLYSATSGSIENAMFLVGGLSELLFDILGIYNWNKYQKQQQIGILNTRLSVCKKSKW